MGMMGLDDLQEKEKTGADKNEEDEQESEKRPQAIRGNSKSYYGGTNQTFMQLV